jgi:hypothetical protein
MLIAGLRLNVCKLGGPAICVNARLQHKLNEQKLVWDNNGEQPKGPVEFLIPGAVDPRPS